MTEPTNLPAVPEPTRRAEVATADTDSWARMAAPIFHLAGQIAETEFVPRGLRGSAPATAAAMLYGREVGLPPMTALNVTHVIEGKPGISAEGMRAMILAAGHDLEVVETTGALCTMRGRRRGGDRWTTITWTTDMARAAGLLSKQNWGKYPRQQLQARATTELARLVFPDVIHGFRSIEELEDEAGEDDTPAGPPAPSTSSKVTRTRKTAAVPPAAPPTGAAPERSVPTGVPLPGEDGYDEAPPTASGPPPEAETGEGKDEVPAPSPRAEGPAEPSPVTPTEEAPQAPMVEERRTADRGSRPVSKAQLSMLHASLSGLGLKGEEARDQRLRIVSRIVGSDVESTANLTTGQASSVIDTIARVKTLADLEALLDATEAAGS